MLGGRKDSGKRPAKAVIDAATTPKIIWRKDEGQLL